MRPIRGSATATRCDKKQEAVIQQSQFFNTNCAAGTLILGLDCALEEQGASVEDVTNIKTSLMGPLAGIGDTLFVTLPQLIFGSIAGYMALEGSPIGVFLWLAYNFLIRFVVCRYMFNTAYKEGSKIISRMGDLMKKVINTSSVLGLTVLGAMIPSFISFTTPITFTQGEVTLELQPYLDKIMPSLLPVLLVGFVYWCLGKKGFTPVKMVFLLMAIGIIGSLIGIIA